MMKPTLVLSIFTAFVSVASQLCLGGTHPSVVSEIITNYSPKECDGSPQAIAAAGTAFIKSLPDARRKEAALPFESAERAKWTNIPPRGEEGGVRLGDLDKEHIQLACDLLNAVMSQQGYEKSRDVMLGDDKLLPNGKPRPGFGAANFWLAVFGDPSADKPWAIQLDGHHIAVNITLVGESISMSPTFIGMQPHKFLFKGNEIVPMAGEVEDAFAFVAALSEDQKAAAIVAQKRGDVQTAAGKDGFIPEPKGLKCDILTEAQKNALLKLTAHWVNNLPAKQADARMKEIAGQINYCQFAWSGPTAPGSDISFILQGPSLIIEYSCQDLGGKPLDHLHSMYRDPSNEYGSRIVSK
ncbi:MAG: DUF3500 domain-containing protein [Verrucomicrobiae bacterium]|nr:DUF3500 domain-containing protein [Verrucomicrobiae bacterium]